MFEGKKPTELAQEALQNNKVQFERIETFCRGTGRFCQGQQCVHVDVMGARTADPGRQGLLATELAVVRPRCGVRTSLLAGRLQPLQGQGRSQAFRVARSQTYDHMRIGPYSPIVMTCTWIRPCTDCNCKALPGSSELWKHSYVWPGSSAGATALKPPSNLGKGCCSPVLGHQTPTNNSNDHSLSQTQPGCSAATHFSTSKRHS